MDNSNNAIKYSIVVPFYNESGIVRSLYERLSRVMKHVGQPYEMVFINDGSRDDTPAVLEEIARQDERVIYVDLRRNFGQTTALQAGFDYSCGQVIIAMDGDLQHDPYEIPLFLKKIDEGYDVASGWRIRRGDGFLLRRLPSRIANKLLARVSGVPLHDFGTTFKAYRREVLEGIRLYGDMHRYVPAIIARWGAKICEVPIKNVRRKAGKSNYGIGRTFRVALDLLTLRFTTAYLTRPMHFFGKGGLFGLASGGAILLYLLVRKLVEWEKFSIMSTHGPLLVMGVILLAAGMVCLTTGLIGEMLMRVYFESGKRQTYAVRRVIRGGRGQQANRPIGQQANRPSGPQGGMLRASLRLRRAGTLSRACRPQVWRGHVQESAPKGSQRVAVGVSPRDGTLHTRAPEGRRSFIA